MPPIRPRPRRARRRPAHADRRQFGPLALPGTAGGGRVGPPHARGDRGVECRRARRHPDPIRDPGRAWRRDGRVRRGPDQGGDRGGPRARRLAGHRRQLCELGRYRRRRFRPSRRLRFGGLQPGRARRRSCRAPARAPGRRARSRRGRQEGAAASRARDDRALPRDGHRAAAARRVASAPARVGGVCHPQVPRPVARLHRPDPAGRPADPAGRHARAGFGIQRQRASSR